MKRRIGHDAGSTFDPLAWRANLSPTVLGTMNTVVLVESEECGSYARLLTAWGNGWSSRAMLTYIADIPDGDMAMEIRAAIEERGLVDRRREFAAMHSLDDDWRAARAGAW